MFLGPDSGVVLCAAPRPGGSWGWWGTAGAVLAGGPPLKPALSARGKRALRGSDVVQLQEVCFRQVVC